MEPKNPLIFVNCARILMTLPTISNDLNLVKQLLIKGLQIAPNDLTVLQAVVKVIILMGRNVSIKFISITVIIYLLIYLVLYN